MQKLGDILNSSSPKEPPQLQAIKKYLAERFDIEPKVIVSTRAYIILAPNAALAHKLRMDSLQIQDRCNLDKKLTIKISA